MRKLAVTYEENAMKINYGKTKSMVVGESHEIFRLMGNVIQRSNEYKHLENLTTVEINSRKDVTGFVRLGK